MFGNVAERDQGLTQEDYLGSRNFESCWRASHGFVVEVAISVHSAARSSLRGL